ncbi:MAG TPA: PHP domain-containing protein [Candidatus Omnitrophota bacterium]|nr:PHP domain-containing protein [Candidatus Omnitrophota bacterium]
MPADLHVHSTFSDGTDTPEEIVELAAKIKLKTLALTDHDTVDGIEPAQKKGAELGVEVIPGIEFTCEIPRTEVHILGYFFDHKSPELLPVLSKIQNSRVERIHRIVEKLNKLGVPIKSEDVLAISGKKSPGRPHVARALVKMGAVSGFKEAFDRYLEYKGPAYVSHYKLSPTEAIKLINKAGGMAALAHPAITNRDNIIPGLVADGLRGIEAYYPGYQDKFTEHYVTLARKYGLLTTGGTDYHGRDAGREATLGDVTVTDELVEKMRNEHLR